MFTQKRFLKIHKLGIVGAGQMGIGIAQVALANAKLQVSIFDANPQQLNQQCLFMDKLLNKNVEKGKLRVDEVNEIRSRRKIVNTIGDLSDCEMIIEAVSENTELKQNIFKTLDSITDKNCILASNTSSISITKISSVTKRPEKVIGMHFMNPVIPGLGTSKETLNKTIEIAKKMGKVTTVSKDIPGFIANRILIPYINEAIFALYEGIATKEDIDTTMKLGTNVPMGPLTLADFVGLDTCLAICRVLHSQLGDPKYRPCPLLVQYVEAGWLGKKAGKGFYDYNVENK
ncbi:hypothetical protein ROZALSC1DRAFT_22891 [Rozella allomycis CSF55]|uniref:3-hydroxybutyryl-CoA dehydrogenase n=1 Tax=Rozella allomycis (strain CSF55) TaxID=988480 RepID=A0A4P9YGX9_ROZAC|nr:hypothetical protein ROZALSC1DRAFT_22891 [Rozella allomycis CSF55]